MNTEPWRDDIRAIGKPYLLFLGDITDPSDAKTAQGIHQWRREWCTAQLRMPGCVVDLGLPDMNPQQAAAAGVRSLVIGLSPIHISDPTRPY